MLCFSILLDFAGLPLFSSSHMSLVRLVTKLKKIEKLTTRSHMEVEGVADLSELCADRTPASAMLFPEVNKEAFRDALTMHASHLISCQKQIMIFSGSNIIGYSASMNELFSHPYSDEFTISF